jgi:hypothetical protein
MSYSQILQVNLITALNTGLNLNFDFAIEGFNLGSVSQNGIVQWYLESAVQVVAVARVNVVSANSYIDVNVALRATGEADLTLTRKLQPQAVFNTGGNV